MTTGGSGGTTNSTDKRLVLLDKQQLADLRNKLRHHDISLVYTTAVLETLLTALIGDQ